MTKAHRESWYQSHIWSMIEDAFDVVKDIDAVVGESVSHSSRKRKNANRHISSLENMDFMQFGHRLDMIFRQSVVDHLEALEYGGCEAGIKDSNGYGTKYLNERMYKLPRALKDMLDRLHQKMQNTNHLQYNQLRTVGFIHSGLNSQMITMDRPTMYVRLLPSGVSPVLNNLPIQAYARTRMLTPDSLRHCFRQSTKQTKGVKLSGQTTMYVSRVNSYKSISIGSHISQFNSLIPAIYSVWACREIVEVMNVVNAFENTSVDLDTCLLNMPPFPMPVTSSSTDTAFTSKPLSKKKTKYQHE